MIFPLTATIIFYMYVVVVNGTNSNLILSRKEIICCFDIKDTAYVEPGLYSFLWISYTNHISLVFSLLTTI